MRVILNVKTRGPRTIITVDRDYRKSDNVHETNIGSAVSETIEEMLGFCKNDSSGKMTLILNNHSEVLDCLSNSRKRPITEYAKEAIMLAMEKIKKDIGENDDTKEILHRLDMSAKRLSL